MKEPEKLIKNLEEKLKKDPNILAIVVYGSYARNESYNDIDVCIFLFPNKRNLSNKLKMSYLNKFPDIFDIHFFSELPLYIQIRVINDGIIISNRDYNVLFDIFTETIKDFNLFEPHLKTYLEVD